MVWLEYVVDGGIFLIMELDVMKCYKLIKLYICEIFYSYCN